MILVVLVCVKNHRKSSLNYLFLKHRECSVYKQTTATIFVKFVSNIDPVAHLWYI